MSLLTPRNPLGVLTESRLTSLGSMKNRQNNILSQSTFFKQAPSSAPSKRRLASDLLADDFDSENIDPSALEPSAKRSKGVEGTPTKISKFALQTTPKTEPIFKFANELSITIPPTSTVTPIGHSRGSPKNRRIAQLTNKRRASTPIRRIDPPGKSIGLPFSIDAALQGTISSYTPKPSTLSAATTPLSPPRKTKKAAPTSWFFAIHEDTQEQESTNLLLHNASTLDISSDDDATSARAKDALERGKENVPPPEYVGAVSRARAARGVAAAMGLVADKDAMEEDRVALREICVKDFYKGEEEEEVVIVEDDEKDVVIPVKESKVHEEVVIHVDEVSTLVEPISTLENHGEIIETHTEATVVSVEQTTV